MKIAEEKGVNVGEVLVIFDALGWSSARFPDRLASALEGAHGIWTLRDGSRLAGIVTSISDGSMCVYFPYIAVHPDYQGKGWGRRLVEVALDAYRDFHHVSLISYSDKTGFYEKAGFRNEGDKVALFYHGETSVIC
jgi:Acetyltransferases